MQHQLINNNGNDNESDLLRTIDENLQQLTQERNNTQNVNSTAEAGRKTVVSDDQENQHRNGQRQQRQISTFYNNDDDVTQEQIDRNDDDLIDPIEQFVKNNNIMPLTAVLQRLQLDRIIEDKPLICILATKFIPLTQLLKDRNVNFADAPIHDADKRTPLHYAIEADDVKAAAWCIEHGNPNSGDNFGNTPILDAIRLNRKRCFLLCLKYKMYDQRAPITAAMYNRHWELKVLHALKFDMYVVRDEDNRTAFERALEYCSLDAAEFLVRVNASLDIDKHKQFTDSQGLIRTLKLVKQQQSTFTQVKSLLWPALIMVAMLWTMGSLGQVLISPFSVIRQSVEAMQTLTVSSTTSTIASTNAPLIIPYEQTFHIYLILGIFMGLLYFLMFVFGTICPANVHYSTSNTIPQLLNEPSYITLLDICPSCMHFTQMQYVHCYKCGSCVEKYHFHGFTCVHKGNEVFWLLVEACWMYFLWMVSVEFDQYLLIGNIQLVQYSSFWLGFVVAQIELLWMKQLYFGLVWLIVLNFLFLHQFFYCLTLLGMMCLRRKYPEVVNSEKFNHLYEVVKFGEKHYMNRQKRVFSRGLLRGPIRSVRNFLVYLFTDN